MTGDERRAVMGLWCASGVGPRAIADVRGVFGSLEVLVDEPVRKWLSAVPLAPAAREGLWQLPGSLGANAEAAFERAERGGMSIVYAGEPAFPRALAELPDAPPLLFFRGRGDRPNGPRRLAMVGSRKFESNLVAAVSGLAEQLARRLIIVSGAAEGVDQLCHRAALAVDGETWAFMGAGLDELDPPQVLLAQQMLERGGTIFSEYPPGVRPERKTFPRRNRLISGSSDAMLLVRAHGESGALHTVRYARKQNRLILALPGQIDHVTAHACNQLIRAGIARLVESARDVFTDMGLEGNHSPEPGLTEAPVDLTTLSPNAQRALDAVERSAADFDVVLSRAGPLSSGQLASALIELELAGLLVQRPGRRYERR